MKTFIQTTFYNSLKPIFLALGIMYVVLCGVHLLVLPESARYLMSVLAGTSAVGLLSTYFTLKKNIPSVRQHTVAIAAFGIIGVPIVNTLVHIYLLPDPKQTTNLLIIIMAAGILVLSSRLYFLLTISCMVGWLILLFNQLDIDNIVHYGIALLIAFSVSAAVHFNRRRIILSLTRNRQLQIDRKKELQEAKYELEGKVFELKVAKEEAEAAAIVKEQFLSNVSHELRTPLNAVIGLAELLEMNDPKPDQIEDLQTLRYSGENLLQLINDVLDFSKINSTALEMEHIPFNLKEMMHQLDRSHRFKATDKGILFSVTSSGYVPASVIGDPLRLKQILNNLLSNAIKFTDEGEVNLIVHGTKNNNNVTLRFEVIDTGIGISEEQMKSIFDPFKQADSAATRKYGGTGLGLAITNKLVTAYGADLAVDSELGKGSTFGFEISVIETSKADIEVSRNDVPHTPFSASTTNLAGMRILMVDDNSVNLAVLGKILSKWNIDTRSANNGQEALEFVQQEDFDIVLMDIQMPIMDGLTATSLIRDLPDSKYLDLPIVALTASTLPEVVSRLYDVGMNGYVFKPFKQEELYNKLQELIN